MTVPLGAAAARSEWLTEAIEGEDSRLGDLCGLLSLLADYRIIACLVDKRGVRSSSAWPLAEGKRKTGELNLG